MTLTEVLSLLFGGGVLWKLFPVISRGIAEPGPILAPSSANMTMGQGDADKVYPRILEIENIGNMPALQTRWEIRQYYPTFPPSFNSVRGSRMIVLKSQERFLLSLVKDGSEVNIPGHSDLSVAHFGSFEILLWYEGPNQVKYLSHLSVWLGDLKHHRVGLNPLQRAFYFLRLRMWVAHIRVVGGIKLTLWLRPGLNRFADWLRRQKR